MAIEIPQNTSIRINIKAFYQQHEYPLTFFLGPHYKLLRKVEKPYPVRDQRNRSSFIFLFLLLNWPSHRSVMHTRKWSLNRVARPRCVHNKPLTTRDSFFCKRSKNCLRSILIFTVCFFLNGRYVDRLYYVPLYIGNLNLYL